MARGLAIPPTVLVVSKSFRKAHPKFVYGVRTSRPYEVVRKCCQVVINQDAHLNVTDVADLGTNTTDDG